ncbi:MAG: hypothetical protein JOZ02_01280 [Acidobacteria bacterium]|nr:hypothetical protein [Acidobacteriota bacterium]
MSTTTTATSTDPTLARYECASGCGTLTFTWQQGDFKGGRLGTASLGQIQNEPIQVFDAQPIYYNGVVIGTNWGFQAQHGSFVGRMYVALHKTIVRFAHFRPGDPWPQAICLFSTPDPRDSREGIEKAA